ncbi:MAG: NAD-binding protein, partial [Candidatus Binataceae bacterium]
MCQKISTLPYEILDSRIDLPLGFYIGLASAESEPQPGGYVGLELSQAVRRFGSRVTVTEVGPQLASREFRDVGAALL